MFTGLIADVGKVVRVVPGDRAATLILQTALASNQFELGDSLAVNGACLTVVSRGRGAISVTAVAETMARTTLGELSVGAPVNLERPMQLGARLDGHLVQGHVDGVGWVEDVRAEGEAHRLVVRHEEALSPYLVEKGSVAVDGVSLTVAALSPGSFEVSVIPHTWSRTALSGARRGTRMNLEMDIIGKYVAKMLGAYGGAPQGLTTESLARHGFF